MKSLLYVYRLKISRLNTDITTPILTNMLSRLFDKILVRIKKQRAFYEVFYVNGNTSLKCLVFNALCKAIKTDVWSYSQWRFVFLFFFNYVWSNLSPAAGSLAVIFAIWLFWVNSVPTNLRHNLLTGIDHGSSKRSKIFSLKKTSTLIFSGFSENIQENPKGFIFEIILRDIQMQFSVTHSMSLVPFCTPCNHQKIFNFLVFSGRIEKDQRQEMG